MFQIRLLPSILILLLASALRLYPFLIQGGISDRGHTADSARYISLAESLDQGHFISQIKSIANPWQEEVFRGLGYPLVINFFNLNYEFIILFQIFLDLLLVILLLRISWIPALLVAINPNLIVAANLIMADSIFAVGFSLAFLAFFYLQRLSFSAIILALINLFRPVGFLLGIIWAALIPNKSAYRTLSFFIIAISVPVLLLIRNFQVTSEVTMSSAWEYNYYVYTAAKLKSQESGQAISLEVENLEKCVENKLHQVGLPNWKTAFKECGNPYLKNKPQLLVELARSIIYMNFAPERLHLLKLLSLEDNRNNFTYFSLVGALLIIQIFYNLLLIIFALLGLWRLFTQKCWFLLSGFVLTLTYFQLASVVVASSRMKTAYVVLLCLLVYEYFKKRDTAVLKI